MKVICNYISVVLLCFGFFQANAQSIQIEAQLDTNKLMIGDQTWLTLKVSLNKSQVVNFPVYSDTIVDKVEIIDQTKTDTIMDDGSRLVLQHKYLLTCFDSGAYDIKAGPFVFNNSDTMWSRNLFLAVNTIPIDTAKGIADIKSPYDAPLEWEEVWIWLKWVLLGIDRKSVV